MTRPLFGRIRLRGWLEAGAPLHVGGNAADVDVDMMLARDGLGRLYVPGTSLAGPIRQWSRSGGPTEARWGSVPRGQGDERSAWASRVFVSDGLVVAERPEGASDWQDGAASARPAPSPEQRDGVGIDRVTGSAATSVLYRREVVPRGAWVSLAVDIEARTEPEQRQDLQEVAVLVRALAAGHLSFGASTTRGLGVLTLDPASVVVRVERLADRAGLLDALGGHAPELGWEALMAEVGEPGIEAETVRRHDGVDEVTVTWRPTGPLMVRAGMEGVAVDAVPLLGETRPGYLVQVLPGSSVKGALRSRAELILRTLLGRPAPRGRDDGNRFLAQMAQEELVVALFGTSAGRELVVLGKATVAVRDCYSCDGDVAAEEWARLFTDEGEAGLSPARRLKMRRADHVAIDRWTGSAAEHLLYSTLEPAGQNWEPLHITLDTRRLPDDLRVPAQALLWLVLRDLKAGLIPLGYATNRGMGDIEVTALSHPWEGSFTEMEEGWQRWLQAQA